MPTEGAYRKIGNGRPMIAPTDLYGKRTSTSCHHPSLCATSPQGEIFCKAPIEGTVGNATEGWQ